MAQRTGRVLLLLLAVAATIDAAPAKRGLTYNPRGYMFVDDEDIGGHDADEDALVVLCHEVSNDLSAYGQFGELVKNELCPIFEQGEDEIPEELWDQLRPTHTEFGDVCKLSSAAMDELQMGNLCALLQALNVIPDTGTGSGSGSGDGIGEVVEVGDGGDCGTPFSESSSEESYYFSGVSFTGDGASFD